GHATQIEEQRRRRGWRGFIVPLPNCTTMGLVVTLKPLVDHFGVERVVMTSMQGVSGAGREQGVLALDILGNIVTYIPGEEARGARETGKILGRIGAGGITPAAFPVSATCTRAAVSEGHTEAVTASLGARATPLDVTAAFREFGSELARLELPSAP